MTSVYFLTIGFLLFLPFLGIITYYYFLLDEFASAAKKECPLQWQKIENDCRMVSFSGQPQESQIAYRMLKAIRTKKLRVSNEVDTLASSAWHWQNIGGACFLMSLLCLLSSTFYK